MEADFATMYDIITFPNYSFVIHYWDGWLSDCKVMLVYILVSCGHILIVILLFKNHLPVVISLFD